MTTPFMSPCYCANLRRAAGAMTEAYDDNFSGLGLSAAQYYLLINLSRLEPVNTTQLARHVGLERSTLVRNMRLLLKNGWAEDWADGREHRFRLTKAGNRLLDQAKPLWEETQRSIMEQLGAEDAEELIRLLRKVQSLKKP
ncbi:MarR family winged helix-turn-helix transcriptional regulator [Bacilliculturomica massiliensis]|uniref:MarR family winged helix-turn-helix transcriptional regulator n=1 Tax=Bacilliculturomica massiliensis TaxID=1917867 RepID=UPI00103022D5|nr:MarR family transcriptional regulator [Bacilliculturomica massiliensis]